MIKNINNTLNIVMGSSIGVLVGNSLYRYYHYKRHPNLYTMQSAPWYTSVIINGLVTFVVISLAIVIKIMVKQRYSKRS